MPIEGIGNVRLEYQRVRFGDRRPFDNRKILAEVMLTADVAKRQGQISKLITALSDEAIGILIEKRRTIEVVVVGQTAKGPVSVLRTTGRQRWIEGRLV